MNKVFLVGRATKDLELRSTPNGTKCVQFSIASSNGKKQDGEKREPDYINCVAWENQAETLHKYFGKGDLISITGKIKTDKYQNDKGENRYKTYVLVREFEFLSKSKESQLPEEPDYIKEKTDSQILSEVMQDTSTDGFADFANEVILTDDDLPF